MRLLNLNEKINLDEKLFLNEEISQENYHDLFINYPKVYKAMLNSDWDEALSYAKENTHDYQMVDVQNDYKFDSEERKIIEDLADDLGLDVRFWEDGDSFSVTADGNEAVNEIPNFINYLDGRDYTSGRVKIVDPILGENRKVTYNNDNGTDVSEMVIDAFTKEEKIGMRKDHTISDICDGGAIDIFKSWANQLGLNTYDNPFISFLGKFDKDNSIVFTKDQLGAINNLYSDNTISNKDLNSSEKDFSIIDNVGIYLNNKKGNDIVNLVKAFNSENSESRKNLYYNEDGLIRNWNDIKKDLGENIQQSSYGRSNKLELDKDAGVEEIQKFFNQLSPSQKLTLRSLVR